MIDEENLVDAFDKWLTPRVSHLTQEDYMEVLEMLIMYLHDQSEELFEDMEDGRLASL